MERVHRRSIHAVNLYIVCSVLSLQIVVGFCDPCTLENNPGWPLRNFLALIAKQWYVNVYM